MRIVRFGATECLIFCALGVCRGQSGVYVKNPLSVPLYRPMATTAANPTKLGRFEIIRPLGKGGQGSVWLAKDPQLKREVALKTLNPKAVSDATSMRKWLDEAIMASQLSHPNIVLVFDAAEDNGQPYVVFEYVKGKTLSALLKASGAMETSKAVHSACALLKALQAAHAKRICHRDIKPGNIMVSEDGIPRLMDFGIAGWLHQDVAATVEGFRGTPQYSAPEVLAGAPFTEQSDTFSMGLVIYEMLTGKPAVSGSSVFEVVHKISNVPIAPPSHVNPKVDEKLNAIIMRALAKDTTERYVSAGHFLEALEAFAAPKADVDTDGSPGTLEFILRRIRHKGDFPALADTISAVNRTTRSDTDPVGVLTRGVLKDFALTNKLLKLVNTAHFGQYGGSISTVSRAVMVLGFDQIRSIAMTLMLFEHLQNKAQANDLKDEVISAYFSGVLARDLVSKAGIREGEEGFICSMFHTLGKLLVAFYFHDEYRELQKLVQHKVDEDAAAVKILGVRYDELGVGVAKSWNFPDKLIESMRAIRDETVRKPANEAERLRSLAELASQASAVLRAEETPDRHARLKALVDRYGTGLGVSEQHLQGALQNATKEVLKDADMLNFKASASTFLGKAQRFTKPDGAAAGEAQASKTSDALASVILNEPVAPVSTGTAPNLEERRSILSAGIQDITNALVGDFQLNDVLRIILETMYRGMGFTRVLLCVRDAGTNTLKSRFGFGPEIDVLLKKGFAIPLTVTKDVFHAAVGQGADIYIDDLNHERIRDHIPKWYREVVHAQALALFPIIVNKKPVGMLYGDCDYAKQLVIGAEELALLKTLRNQAVLAIKSNTA